MHDRPKKPAHAPRRYDRKRRPTNAPPARRRNLFRTLLSDVAQLGKLRLTFLVVLTTLAGYYLGSHGPFNVVLLLHTLGGTTLVAGAASALNQFLEREHDALMARTEDRPLPAGRLPAREVALISAVAGLVGTLWLAVEVNFLTAALALTTLLIYTLIYTPLKRVTPLNTLVGAIPGALPPTIGWAAARNDLDAHALTLFAILFLWQLAHFYAIAWLYRDEYAAAGFHMSSLRDTAGLHTARASVLAAVLLIPVALCPYWLGMAGLIYAIGATLATLGFAACAIYFFIMPVNRRARLLFLASIMYLPFMLVLMTADKL